MENFLCAPIKPFKPTSPSCGPAVKGTVKTVYVDAEAYKKVGMIEAATNDGRSVIIDNSISNVIPKVMVPIVNYNKLPIEQHQKDNARELTRKDLNAADIPADKKKLIAAEYMRLCRKHPNWKAHKAMRKAGEKYNVKFTFE
jgi:hypothetical protein